MLCAAREHRYLDPMGTPHEKPNPGSDAALDLGCICPVLGNTRGKWVPWQGGYLVITGCPVHDPTEDLAEGPTDGDALLSYPTRRATRQNRN
jgi:hypothetical protein